MDIRIAWGAVGIMVGCMTSVQVLFKAAATYSTIHPELQKGWLFNPWLAFAAIFMFIGTVAWVLALRRLPLSQAYPWTASIYVLTPVASVLIFNDIISLQYVIGMAFICFGIFLATRNAAPANVSS